MDLIQINAYNETLSQKKGIFKVILNSSESP